MSQLLTTRSLMTLLIAAMISVQSVAMGVTAGGVTADCEAIRSCHEPTATRTCCRASQKSCCSVRTGCCCDKSEKSRCSVVCSCGKHESTPAAPYESQARNDLRQLLAFASGQPAIPSLMKTRPLPQSVELFVRPTAKAGINAMFCVWRT